MSAFSAVSVRRGSTTTIVRAGIELQVMIRIGQSYKKQPPEGDYDAIIIGSGVGGLATAALLAKHGGKRVLVLERHYMPGGFTHVFRRRGYEWDVGVHYIGGVGDRRSATRRLFDHITDGSLEWAPMGEVYDRIILGENELRLRGWSGKLCSSDEGVLPG